MNQLRLDPLTGRWVVVSTDRSHRPFHFATPVPVQEDTSRPCPFCPGNEESTPPALETYGSSGHWLVRVVPNLIPPSRATTPSWWSNRGPVFTQATAGGIHEVLVLSPEHDRGWDDLSDEQPALVMAAIRDRIEEHSVGTGTALQPGHRQRRAGGGRLDRAPPRPAPGDVVRAPRARRGAGRLRPLRRSVPAVHHRGRRGGRRAPGRLRRRAGAGGVPLLERHPLRDARHPPHPRAPSPPGHPGGPVCGGPVAAHRPGPLASASATWPTTSSSTRPRTGHPSRTTGTSTCWPKLTTPAGFELGTGVLINIVPPEQATEELRVAVPA